MSKKITDEDLEMDSLIPDSSNQPYDMHRIIEHLLDDGDFLEVAEALQATLGAVDRGLREPGAFQLAHLATQDLIFGDGAVTEQ